MKALITIMMVLPWFVKAQDSQPDLDELSEQLAMLQSDDEISEEQFENMTHLLSHPLNLNKATADELRFAGILTEEQVMAIIEHRKRFGPFISTLELQSIPNLNADQIHRLLPYVRVRDPSTEINRSLLSRIRNESDTYLLLRYESGLEDRKGFTNTSKDADRFRGKPGKSYLRFRSSKAGDFSFGITAENDPGETFRWDLAQKKLGPDYLSFHAQTQNKGIVQNLIVGDYQAQFGQGLVWGGISGSGKGAETITAIRRCNVGYVPYTSAYESGNLRGIATTLEPTKGIRINVSASSAFRDGTITSDGNVSSWQYSGLHRNTGELESRKSVREQVIGSVIQLQRGSFDAGVSFQHVGFDKTFRPQSRIYSQHAFSGSSNTNVGAYGNYTLRNSSIFSEVAHTPGQGFAFVAGGLFALTTKFDLSILHRNYQQDFHPFYGNAIAENTKSQNETGTYWGWKYRFSRRWSYAGYVDLFRFPGLKFRTYAPSQGFEWLMRLSWQPSRTMLLFIQAREENKARNIDHDGPTYYVANVRKRNYWLTTEYGVGQKFRFRSRVLFSQFTSGSSASQGFALAQDITVHVNRWKFSGRYALFDTDDWDNRLYLYEQDVWLAYSLPAYDGVGVRKILVVEYKASRMFTFWLRYAQTRYTDRKEIGSGGDQILGDTRNDLKLQVRIRF